jgi:phage terminase small subunit
MAKSPDKKLTPQQEKFVQEYIATSNASEAYKRAYPNALKWKQDSVKSKAYKMLQRDYIGNRIAQLQQKTQEKFEVTLESIIAEFDDAIKFAKELKTVPPIVKAITKKAELMGLFKEHNRQNGVSDLANALREAGRN